MSKEWPENRQSMVSHSSGLAAQNAFHFHQRETRLIQRPRDFQKMNELERFDWEAKPRRDLPEFYLNENASCETRRVGFSGRRCRRKGVFETTIFLPFSSVELEVARLVFGRLRLAGAVLPVHPSPFQPDAL